eukprot:CAMPEP_0113724898 /NCGR_PEP_ID=MMETSP0038_2-20120614/39378_1 /TAXON_ID=2898 /ORGANISM="Cryptomonas paramecium" /LENGTH=292 /DNA_ID=CAMNT_0000654937 /DNA_START=17 /DNA_END=891 /DNA_ORIENTATION=- /assembly_acc=CAM_ASM_000170
MAQINVGDEVYYYSQSYEEWMQAKVEGINEDGSFELDIKSGAHPSLVRKNPTKEELASKPVREEAAPVIYTTPIAPMVSLSDLPPGQKANAIVSRFVADLQAFHAASHGQLFFAADLLNHIALAIDGQFLSPQVMVLYLQIPQDQEVVFVSFDQIFGAMVAFAKPTDDETTYENRVITHVRARTRKLEHAQSILAEVTERLTFVHTQARGSTPKLLQWFRRVVPKEIKDQAVRDFFLGTVIRPPINPQVSLTQFLFGVAGSIDETDTLERFREATESAAASLSAAPSAAAPL